LRKRKMESMWKEKLKVWKVREKEGDLVHVEWRQP
jgi:hypothetical protein